MSILWSPRPAATLALLCLIAGTGLWARKMKASPPTTMPPNPEAGRKSCKPDVMRLCPTKIFAGREAVQACLKAKRVELSPKCRDYFDRAMVFQKQMRAHCGADIQRHCAALRDEPEKLRACIRKNIHSFSDPCRSFLGRHYGRGDTP